MAESNLNKVLSALHLTDEYMWGKLSGVQDRLSGLISSSFAQNKIVIGNGANGITSSQFTLDATTTSAAFTGDALSTTIANALAIKAYVDDSIAAEKAEQGNALTGLTLDANSLTGSLTDKNYSLGVKVDGLTIDKGVDGLKSVVKLVKAGTATSGFAATYKLANSEGTPIEGSAEINIPKDQFLSSAVYNATDESIDLTFAVPGATGDQLPALVKIPVSGLVHEFEGTGGVAINYNGNGTSSVISGVVDPTNNATDGFLKVGANGFYTEGIKTAIENASSDANAGLTTLSGALTDYLSGNAVKNKFDAIDTKLADVVAANSGKVLSIDSTGNIDATDYVFGSNDTLSANFGTANTLATETAAKTYADGVSAVLSAAVAAEIQEANSGLEKAMSGVLTADQFVFGAGEGEVKTDGKTLSTDMISVQDDNTIPTTEAVHEYVNDGLSALLQQVNDLKDSINA